MNEKASLETWFLFQNAVFLKLRFGASTADSTITFFSESVIYLITHVHIKFFFTSNGDLVFLERWKEL